MTSTQDVSFLEAFALGTDRKAVLKNLVPGSQDHFSYLCLLAEQSGHPADLQAEIDEGIKQRGEDHLVRAYKARKQVATYDRSVTPGTSVLSSTAAKNNAEALQTLRTALGLGGINYSRPHDAPPPASDDAAAAAAASAVPTGPSSLTPELQAKMVESEVLQAVIAANKPTFLHSLSSSSTAHEHPVAIAALEASEESLAVNLMAMSGRGIPETENAIDLIAKAYSSAYVTDRHWQDSILQNVIPSMTFAQIEALCDRLPAIKTQETVVSARIARLSPSSSIDFRTDRAALLSYLNAVTAVVTPLPPSFNSLRLALLHQQLRAMQKDPNGNGKLDSAEAKVLVEKYLALPRDNFAHAPAFKSHIDTFHSTNAWARPGAGTQSIQSLAFQPCDWSDDNDLWSKALTDIFASTPGDSLAPWNKYVPEETLKPILAKAKITFGADAERAKAADWAKLLQGGMDELKRISDEVILRFAPHNREYIPVVNSNGNGSSSSGSNAAAASIDASTNTLKVHIDAKNVPKVTISVFEINTTSFYCESGGAEVTSDIQLDGLTPFSSWTHDFAPGGEAAKLQPLQVHSLSFPMPALDATSLACGGRGVWIVDVVGAGRSIRAVIRRGALRIVERKTIAGHLLTVLDEQNIPLPRDRVAIYMSGRRFTPLPVVAEGADNSNTTTTTTSSSSSNAAPAAPATGAKAIATNTLIPEVLIPYGSGSSSQKLVVTLLGNSESAPAAPTATATTSTTSAAASGTGVVDTAWSFSTLVPFTHESEKYKMDCSFAVERESIVRDNYSATLMIRPKVSLIAGGDASSGLTIPLKALEHVTLTITATDAEGVTSQRVQRNFPFSYDGETAIPFAVPANVRALSFKVSGEIELIASGSKQTLSASHSITVNQIDTSGETRTVFLRNTEAKGYSLHLLGKTGEPIPGISLLIDLTHYLIMDQPHLKHCHSAPFQHTLVTDANGTVVLGPLPGWTSIRVSGAWGAGGNHQIASFELPRDVFAYPTSVHTVTAVGTPAPSADVAIVGAGSSSSSSGGNWLSSLLGGTKAPTMSSLAAPASLAAETGDVQARFPFRPTLQRTNGVVSSTSASASNATYVLTRRDFKLTEMRAIPCGAGSIQWTGANRTGSLVPVADMFAHAKYDAASGFITIRGLPPGEYVARVKRPFPGAAQAGPEVTIRVLPAATTSVVGGQLVCGDTMLQARPGVTTAAGAAAACPVQIASVSIDHARNSLVVHVTGGAGSSGGAASSKDVRVHAVATYFVPMWNIPALLAGNPIAGLGMTRQSPIRSRYLEKSRQLGEETLYVLERKERVRAGGITPGNLLPRPSLLLNPWSLGPVATDIQEAASGTSLACFADSANGSFLSSAAGGGISGGMGGPDASRHASFLTLDFLQRPAAVLCNLRPDPITGLVVIPLASFLGKAGAAALSATSTTNNNEAIQALLRTMDEFTVTLVAADASTTAGTSLNVPTLPASARLASALVSPFRDLTNAASSLDPNSHVVQRSRTSLLATPGSKVEMAAAASYTTAEVYTSLERAAGLLASLSNSAPLIAEWIPLLAWPSLSQKEKRARYSKWACHEFHMFLFFRDPEFFKTVVAPYLSTKRSKTFVDHWLLGASADPSNALDGGAAAGAHWAGLRAYAKPNVFERLNPFEQALLVAAMGTEEERKGVVQYSKDWAEANPIPTDMRTRVFKAAIASNALEASGAELENLLATTEAQRESTRRSKPAAPVLQTAGFSVERSAAPMARGLAMKRSAAVPQAKMMSFGSVNGGPPLPPSVGAGSARMMQLPMSAPMSAMTMAAPPMMMMARSMMSFDDGPMAEASATLVDMGYDAQEELDDADLALVGTARQNQGFRPLDKTEEFTESHYFGLRIGGGDRQATNLVAPSAFWADFASHVARVTSAAHAGLAGSGNIASLAHQAAAVAAALRSTPFASAFFPMSAVSGGSGPNGSLNDMLLTLGVLGLPLERSPTQPPERPTAGLSPDAMRLIYTAGATPAVLFHQDIDTVPAPPAAAAASILCGQQYIDPSDPQEWVNNQSVTKFLAPAPTDGAIELQPGKVYQAHIVISNISAASRTLEVFTHIPGGSLPANNGSMVTTRSIVLGAYSTTNFQYPFYMPRLGTFNHFPVHVSSAEGELLAFAAPTKLRVTTRPVTRDTTSWRYIAANGSEAEILEYLRTANRIRVDLNQLLWRLMGNAKPFFTSVITLLRTRQWWSNEVWAISFLHSDVTGMEEYMAREQSLQTLRRLFGNAPLFTSPLITIAGEEGVGRTGDEPADAVPSYNRYIVPVNANGDSGGVYEHLEYSPLVNARAHQLGVKRRILNKAVARQYRSLLHVLCAKPMKSVSAADLMAIAYHQLLQDRVEDASAIFARVPAPSDSIAAAVVAAAAGGSSGTTIPSHAPALDAVSGSSRAATSDSWSTLQYDYMAAYLDFYRADGEYTLPVATAVARAYADHPVPKWAAKFRELDVQLQETGVLAISSDARAAAAATSAAEGGSGGTLSDRDNASESAVSKEASRESAQSAAMARAPTMEMSMEGSTLIVTYSNLHTNVAAVGTPISASLRLFTMDLELLFSTNPFMTITSNGGGSGGGGNSSSSGGSGGASSSSSASSGGGGSGRGGGAGGMFEFVRPNGFITHSLPYVPVGRIGEARFSLPPAFEKSNVMVEIAAAGLRRSAPYYATSLVVTVSEAFGRLRVTDATTGRPLPRTYVKVYYSERSNPVPLNNTQGGGGNGGGGASNRDGKFFKDGYTDARGAFDYTSLSTDELARAKKFAILVSSEAYGAVVRTANPPGTR